MRVLVTGGAGYIGSHTAKRLAEEGFEPVVLDNLSTGHASAVRWGPLIVGDVADASLLRDVLHRHHIEAVLHFAASAYVGESMTNPRHYFQNNIVASLALLDAMLDAGVAYIVFSSSCTTYGMPETVPIAEGHPQRPISPYGESKLFIERALYWYGIGHGLRWMVLRYFNAAGADPEGTIGEAHSPETHLIPLAIHAALGKRAALDVYGTNHPTPDGTAIRDYVHVTDLADAHARSLRRLLDGGANLALNLGTGHGHSVRDVVSAVEAAARRQVPVRESAPRPGDPPMLVADADRANETLGWRPHLSSLASIVSTAWRWHAAGNQPPHRSLSRGDGSSLTGQ